MSSPAAARPVVPDFTAEPARFGEIECRSRRGAHRMVYADWGPLDAKTTVVCVHALTRQGRDYDPLAAALAAEGVRVICPDLPGRGRSEPLYDVLDYSLAQHCDELGALLATLDPATNVAWVGTSLGGLIGISLAGSGDRISRLVINDIGPVVPLAASMRVFFKLARAPTSFASLDAAEHYFRRNFKGYGELGDVHWRHVTRYSVEMGANGRYRWLLDPRIGLGLYMARTTRSDLWKEWKAISAPILLLRGAESDFLSRELAREMTGANPAARLLEIDGVGHMPMLASPLEIGAIRDFLLTQ
jgi:pimeloyl-ACP methyl ester carboxylesterase